MLLRPLAQSHAWPLFGLDATRRIEAAAQAGLPPHALMARAGLAGASLARALAPHAQRAWIACGRGNNGGDGLEAAVHLKAAGLAVDVTLTADPSALPADARAAWQRAVDAGVLVSATLPATPPGVCDIAIDALLGIGARGAPDGPMRACAERFASLHCTVLAIDVPSGLNADTGQPFGAACVRATHTLSLLTLKPGLFTGAGRDHAGDVWFDALGVEPPAERPDARLSARPEISGRLHAQHKGSFGDVLVVGGAIGMSGAAMLAARAAHAAGAGRVHVDLLGPDVGDPVRPELMFKPGATTTDLARRATVVAGCGGGTDIATVLPRLLAVAPRLVLDADALNAIGRDVSLQELLTARVGRGKATVLTPHPLEAARLLDSDTATVQSDRLAAAGRLAARFGVTVVLKGSGSVVASPGQCPVVNPTGNAALATAGTGDVLAGWLGGQWAATADTAFAVAGRSTWEHGHAADRSTARTMRAADLVDALHALQRR